MADAFYSPESKSFVGAPSDYPNYDTMIATMVHYAEQNRYVLAAIFAMTPERAHYYYVRPDCPDSREIVEGIQGLRYVWPGSGQEVANVVPR